MFTVTTSPSSIKIREKKSNNSIALVYRNEEIEFHQMIDGRASKAIQDLQNELKDIVKNRLPKRHSYKQRFSTVASIIRNCENVNSFMTLKNRLNQAVVSLS